MDILVGLTYDLREDYTKNGVDLEDVAEFDCEETIAAIESALQNMGMRTQRIGNVKALAARLVAGDRWDLVFNIAEGLGGRSREAQVPSLLEIYKIPYTFSDPLTCAVTLDKGISKRLIEQAGLNTPKFAVIHCLEDLDKIQLSGPLFVKPLQEGTGIGITGTSKIDDQTTLRDRVQAILLKHRQPALIEEYLPGREFTTGVVGTGQKARVVGTMEVHVRSGADYGYQAKQNWEKEVTYSKPPHDETLVQIEQLALASHRTLECRDVSRVDLRVDHTGKASFIEINALPGLNPTYSDLPILCGMYGISYQSLMNDIVKSALERTRTTGVLVLYNNPRSEAIFPESDMGVLAELESVLMSLDKLQIQYRAFPVNNIQELPKILTESPELTVFNLVEALPGSSDYANLIPALANAFGKACTGNPIHCLRNSLNKYVSKQILAKAGVPVPEGYVFKLGDSIKVPPGTYIIKPLDTDASEDIDARISVQNETNVESIVKMFFNRNQPALVETFCEGRELNVSILEIDNNPIVIGISEIRFDGMPEGYAKIVDYDAKWLPDTPTYLHTKRVVPAPIPEQLQRKVEEIAIRAFKALDCSGYARIDMRTDINGEPFVLEVNPNPDISPDSGYVETLQLASMDHTDLVKHILAKTQIPSVIRPTRATDEQEIINLVKATEFFPINEIEVAQEVLQDAIAGKDNGHYRSFTAVLDGKIVGWACAGPTPCANGIWDLYWIAIHPQAQRKGLAKALLNVVEAVAKAHGARKLIAETSGRAIYIPTHNFYFACQFCEEARVKDFYDQADDKLVFTKII